jgi:hypothetical protein
MGKKTKKLVAGTMSEEQQRELIAKVIVNLPSGISSEIAQKWITDKTGALGRLLAPLSKNPSVRFVVADHFKVDTSDTAEVKISSLGDNFRTWFSGKTEEMSEIMLPRFHHLLTKDSRDDEILDDLGGADKAEVAMAGIYQVLKECQARDDRGGWQLFYAKDAGGVLRAVDAFWDGDVWRVNANSIGDVVRWRAVDRVFSAPLLAA